MQRTNIALAIWLTLIAISTLAEPVRDVVLTATFGTNATVEASESTTKFRGQIESLEFDVVTPGTTGDVSIVIIPESPATMDSFVLFSTNNVDTDIRFRPVLPSHQSDGTPLLSDERTMYSIYGDTLKFAVTNASTTNISFKCRIKLRRGN